MGTNPVQQFGIERFLAFGTDAKDAVFFFQVPESKPII
jgi:hypothetical protein